VGVEQVLDRRRRHVLALGGLEQLLGAAGDAQHAVGALLAQVAGAEEAVVGEDSAVSSGCL
jgi:hypothetical protein